MDEVENQEQNQEQISLIDEMHEENQEQTALMDEVENQEQNQEQIKLELSKTFEKTKWESNDLETAISNGIFNKDQNSNIKQLSYNQKLPLPNIKNLRKWINSNKKAS